MYYGTCHETPYLHIIIYNCTSAVYSVIMEQLNMTKGVYVNEQVDGNLERSL